MYTVSKVKQTYQAASQLRDEEEEEAENKLGGVSS